MLNNFIYAQTKDLFLDKLNAGEILDEAIVFIEDTKEIWNHGHYFGGIDPILLDSIQDSISKIQNTTDNLSSILDSVVSTKLDTEIAATVYTTKDELKTTKTQLSSEIDDLEVRVDTNEASIRSLAEIKLDIDQAASVYATQEVVNRKQNILVSGTNIKTINGESILGLGDLVIDTSVLNSVGTHTGKAMSQKATTDAIKNETERATGVENDLQMQITQHESVTQSALDTAEYAEVLAIDANTRSQNAETVANSAIEAVKALEGLGSTDEAQTTLAERVAQIAVNSDAIAVLQEKHVLISEEAYEALDFKDPTKIYLIYEE